MQWNIRTYFSSLSLASASIPVPEQTLAQLTQQSALFLPGEEVTSGSSRPSTRESIPQRLPSPTRKSRANIKLVLVHAAERALGMLTHHRGEGAACVEVRVHALLALARLAVCLQHSVSGYQLSLQALRLLQALEEEGMAGGVATPLREVDVHLWLECRYWLVRSVVGLEAVPGGGGMLLEVGEHCEECLKLGEVELVAAMELAAAEHAMALLPCQLQAAQQHSQVPYR